MNQLVQSRVAEADLIARAVSGDGDAFADLVRPYESKIYSLAYRMCGDREEAFDLSQEAFLKAYRALGRFNGNASFSTWLYRVASNTCLDRLRRRQRSVPVVSLDETLETESGSLRRDVADTTFEPENIALRAEAAAQIRVAVAGLPGDQRLAIILRDFQGLSYEDIAATTGATLGTVKSRISRARAALRDHLAAKELLPQVSVYTDSPSPQAVPPRRGPARGVDA